MYELPTSVVIEDVRYPIRNGGDYRVVLDVFSILEEYTLTQTERILSALIVFYDGFEDIEDVSRFNDMEQAVHGMYDFFNAGRPDGKGMDHKLIDWEQDSAMIASAINNVAGKEVRSEEYVHWWTFMGWYMAIGESTLSTVVDLRSKTLKGEHLEKWERKFKQENPQYFVWNHQTVEQREAEAWVMNVWNKE